MPIYVSPTLLSLIDTAIVNATGDYGGGILVASLAISDSSSGATVGVVLEDIENGTSSGIYLEHTDLEGGDYRYFGVNYTDPHRCEAACDSAIGRAVFRVV